MQRFFRHIRQRLLRENRLSKYLLYALGEITLVVIGILIALQVNNWNEQRKNEEAIRMILAEIQHDLLNDIEEFGLALEWSASTDSACTRIIENRQNKEDYQDPARQELFTIGIRGFQLEPSDRSYQLLVSRQEQLSAEYASLMESLNSLYVEDQGFLEKAQTDLRQLGNSYNSFLHDHFAWVLEVDAKGYSEEAVRYYTEDSLHKRKLLLYREHLREYQHYAWRIKDKAVTNYLIIRHMKGDTGSLPEIIRGYGILDKPTTGVYDGILSYTNDAGVNYRTRIYQQYGLVFWEDLNQYSFYLKNTLLQELSADSLQFVANKRFTMKIMRGESGEITGAHLYNAGQWAQDYIAE